MTGIGGSISENVKAIRGAIAAAAAFSGRSGGEITLVAASKTQSAERVRQAVEAGVDAAGENRVQELCEKLEMGAYDGIPVHFIGHLQRNKLKKVVGAVGLIESADSLQLIRLISERAFELGITQDLLIQVNIAGEGTKGGFPPGELRGVLDEAAALPSICVRGLMAIPPISPVNGANRVYFAAMRKLFIDIKGEKYDNVSMDFLSMGMSGDYIDAVYEGANMVRVGSAIFGGRG